MSNGVENNGGSLDYVERNEAKARELEVPLMIVEQKVDFIE